MKGLRGFFCVFAVGMLLFSGAASQADEILTAFRPLSALPLNTDKTGQRRRYANKESRAGG